MTEFPEGFKIDPTKYVGLPPEEARRRMDEDERRAINDDPRLQAHLRDMDRRRAQEAEEEKRAAVQLENRREREFSEALEAHRRDRLGFYRAQGVPEKVFDQDLWPDLRRRFVSGEEDAVDRERRERSTSVY